MKICIPVRESNLRKAVLQVKRASRYADFVEIWFDVFENEDEIKKLIKSSGKPVIAVCRAAIEHGSFKGSEKERIEVLKNAVSAGARFCDVGIRIDKKLIADLKKTCKKYGASLIVSRHFWFSTPSLAVLLKTAGTARNLGADIVKIATQINKWKENVVLFELTKRLSQKDIPAIVIGMGERGKVSRIGTPFLGAFLTYAALDKKSKTAQGQFTIKELKALSIF